MIAPYITEEEKQSLKTALEQKVTGTVGLFYCLQILALAGVFTLQLGHQILYIHNSLI